MFRAKCAKARVTTRETLEVKYKGKNIHDVLEMTVEEACGFFANIPRIHRKLQTLYDVGPWLYHTGAKCHHPFRAARPSV